MNGKQAKRLRSLAQEMTIGLQARDTRRVYRQLKRQYRKNPADRALMRIRRSV